MTRPWEFWIDVGGTFTDCLGLDPSNRLHQHKLLSTGVYRTSLIAIHSSTEVAIGIKDAPTGFFNGYQVRFRMGTGEDRVARVVRRDARTGVIILDQSLPQGITAGAMLELTSGEEAPLVGIRWILGKRMDEPIGPCVVRLGTTRATNALLERGGAPTALAITQGFRDLLRIGHQDRPRLFDLNIRRALPLAQAVIEIPERLDAKGNVLIPLDESTSMERLRAVRGAGITSLAIGLLHSFRYDQHERRLFELAVSVGFEHVSCSSRLSRSQRLVTRGDTTLVDAYVTPVLSEYLARIHAGLPEAKIELMTSSGALAKGTSFFGKDAILSGPAGGVVGARAASMAAGFKSAIAFDMGGTSTDVSRQAGSLDRRYVMELRDPESGSAIRVSAPMLHIETVAAGGGSICRFDGERARVGPQSAGASPGPACYGQGGPLTITDCHVYLGRIPPTYFSLPLDREAVVRRLDAMIEEIEKRKGQELTREALAEGFLEIANDNMSAAIRRISTARGFDVRGDVLVSFGGAGGQHACEVARRLNVRQVLQHPFAGILSAYGIGHAEVRKFGERPIGLIDGHQAHQQVQQAYEELLRDIKRQLNDEGFPSDQHAAPKFLVDVRYRGQDSMLTLEWPEQGDIARSFEEAHRSQFGFVFPNRAIEIQQARVECGCLPRALQVSPPSNSDALPASSVTRACFQGEWKVVPVFDRKSLAQQGTVAGPCIILESISTIVVTDGWSAEVDSLGNVILRDNTSGISGETLADADFDPIRLELFANRFMSIAEQMGTTLQKTALSTNIKERLDFSCAVFTGEGQLIANAPHIPVHLGAMGETIRRIRVEFPDMCDGEVFLTNDPFRGGSHLPDVTVMTPVFLNGESRPAFFTACRAHHAEIGGIVPGSMPPFSKNLAEEGVLLPPIRLDVGDPSNEQALRHLLVDSPYPTRQVEENLADIRAQSSANHVGVQLLKEWSGEQGVDMLRKSVQLLHESAERKMREALGAKRPGRFEFTDHLDDGSMIAVALTIIHDDTGHRAVVDFTGTSGVSATNLNANPAIVRSAVLYVFRCLLSDDIPLNDGVLEPIEIVIPPGCLLHPIPSDDPTHCPAVGGGNVETSQRVVDVLLGALGVVSASQGTMNNLLFGRATKDGKPGFGFYETICGGSGAGPGFHGTSAVHTHMTNTRITDPEILEDRFPVRLNEFSIREGSGGKGESQGGDGAIREMLFLEDVELSLVTNRRTTAPFGLAGGANGARGRNILIRADGTREELGPFVQQEIKAGEAIRMETPGGGGYGTPSG